MRRLFETLAVGTVAYMLSLGILPLLGVSERFLAQDHILGWGFSVLGAYFTDPRRWS